MLYFVLLISFSLRGVESQLVWDCSTVTNGIRYFPELMTNSLSPNTDLSPSVLGRTDIYTVPDNLACLGTVTDVEFCYDVRNNQRNGNDSGYLVFTLCTLSQSGTSFRKQKCIEVYGNPRQNSDSSTCRGSGMFRTCCDISSLDTDNQFHFSSSIAIGIIIPSNPTVFLQRFDSSMAVRVYQEQLSYQQEMYTFQSDTSDGFQVFRLRLNPLTTPPTNAPTDPPTDSSTTLPTNPSTAPPTDPPTTPTHSPTAPPTDPPSAPPTDPPSAPPTNLPTAPLTDSSTTLPTNPPTSLPTDPPTTPPTHSPSAPPTDPSTAPPTDPPTAPPTDPPTAPPTDPPTILPTDQSTVPVPIVPPDSSTTSYFSVPPGTSTIADSNAAVRDLYGSTNSRGSNNINAKVGGAVTGSVGVLIVMVVCLLSIAIVMACRFRKSRRKINIEIESCLLDDMKTSCYTRVEDDTIGMIDLKPIPSEAHWNMDNLNPATSCFSYDYVEEGPTTCNNDAKVKDIPPTMHEEYDDIYVVPASNVVALYAQLEKTYSDDIYRKSISLGDMLGSGQFGEVFRGVWQSRNKSIEVAVKTLKEGSSENDKVKFLQEAAIMGQFKHPNVVNMYGVVTDGEPILLVLEMLKEGDLRNYLISKRNDTSVINEHELLSYCRHIASGMTYLSSKAFVHRDLAARNILVSDDRICKIADFGMSRDLANEDYYLSSGGKIPIKWTAPEALYYKKYSTSSDVWSYGVVMYEIWSLGHKPFEKINNTQVMKVVNAGYRLPPPPGCPRAIYGIMMSCWDPEPGGRPSFSDISTFLSFSNSRLLHWSQHDRTECPEGSKLGANLISADKLYEDVQAKYRNTSDNYL